MSLTSSNLRSTIALAFLFAGCGEIASPPVTDDGLEPDLAAAAMGTTPISLGTLGQNFSRADGISDAGHVVGGSFTSAGQFHAFLWTATDGMTDLGTLGGSQSQAFAVNSSGHVVGGAQNAAGVSRPFLWTPDDGMVEIATPGFVAGFAFGINEDGTVVGRMNNPGSRAFLWTPDDGITDLGNLGANFAVAHDINDAEAVTGISQPSAITPFHAFLWSAADGMTDLGTLGGTFSDGRAVNAAGHVAGYSVTDPNARPNFRAGRHAFLWTPGDGMTDLGAPAGGFTEGHGLSDAGEVVGTIDDGSGDLRGFHWTRAGGMTSLPPLTGGTSTEARAINDAGLVAGFSDSPDGTRAVIWTVAPPVIEVGVDIKPGSWPNSINSRSRGVIPVAILSAADFDAPDRVDPASLTFGATGDEASLRRHGRSQVPNCGVEDADGDGLADLVCRFRTPEAGFAVGDTEGILRGATVDDEAIEGRDAVRIVR